MAKTLTFTAMFKKMLEDHCTKSGIEFKRKNGGLRLNLFAFPEVYPSETEIRIQMIGGTGGFQGGTRQYSNMFFKIGDIADPRTDPEAVVNRVIQTIDYYAKITQFADSTDPLIRY